MKAAFASDLPNLIPAGLGVNRHEKSARDVAEWTPGLNARCRAGIPRTVTCGTETATGWSASSGGSSWKEADRRSGGAATFAVVRACRQVSEASLRSGPAAVRER